MQKPIIAKDADVVTRSRAQNQPGIYMILPKGSRVESSLPQFDRTIAQVLTAPALGAKFVEHELHIQPGGGSTGSINDGFEAFFFVLEGNVELNLGGETYTLEQGWFFWSPPDITYQIQNQGKGLCRALWLRKRYHAVEGVLIPKPFVKDSKDVTAIAEDTYYERHLIPYDNDFGFDMGFNLLIFEPGIYFSFVESHIMEHGMYMLTGRGIYVLNSDYIEVEQGDYIYMAPYCPQTFYPNGWEQSSYILYKDVNRDYLTGL